MKIPVQLQDPPKDKPKWWQSLQRIYQIVARVINGNISIGNASNMTANNNANPNNVDNIQGAMIYAAFVAANTNLTLNHNLGYVPRAYIPVVKNAAGDVYDGTVSTTTTQITLKCTTITNIVLFVF